ncbi:hypothetical protein Dvina_17010 [Dactylosporangium vinaceum]|uniref:Uncharacterized protein n=1 Tax=Dactylosporangium vinaceum TaxID=53362 RepID=A0ABV5MKC9_9ACTN|nr:hypothetical protein [Dactylosporangium vinaceum]UAB99617.1 hypothetical protein Dvina_17010 [Dactylosporangium vinaceum]
MTEPEDRFDGCLEQHRIEPLGPPQGAYERIARTARRRRVARVAAISATAVVLFAGITGLTYRIVTAPAPVPPPGASKSP